MNKIKNSFKFAIVNMIIGLIYLSLVCLIAWLESLVIHDPIIYLLSVIFSVIFVTLFCISAIGESEAE